MLEYLKFCEQQSFIKLSDTFFKESKIDKAFELTCKDLRYHYKEFTDEMIREFLYSNSAYLAIYLYRLGNLIWQDNPNSNDLKFLHGMLREKCSCEIYFSNMIGEGFLIPHSIGIVLGSRNRIGKGFVIYQNSSIAHKFDKGIGCDIGENVTLFASSNIIGELEIGSDVQIGAKTVITKDVPQKMVVYGNPNLFKKNIKIGSSIRDRFIK